MKSLRKVLALLLTAAMVFGTFSVTAFAENPTESEIVAPDSEAGGEEDSRIAITTEEELYAFFGSAGGEAYLANDITVGQTAGSFWASGSNPACKGNAVLDLNGKQIVAGEGTNVRFINVNKGKSLTIDDNNDPAGRGGVYGFSVNNYVVYVNDEGGTSFTLNGGTIDGSSCNYAVWYNLSSGGTSSASFEMNGGTLINGSLGAVAITASAASAITSATINDGNAGKIVVNKATGGARVYINGGVAAYENTKGTSPKLSVTGGCVDMSTSTRISANDGITGGFFTGLNDTNTPVLADGYSYCDVLDAPEGYATAVVNDTAEYTIHFVDGETKYTEYGSYNAPVLGKELTKDGYTLTWNTAEDGTGKGVNVGDPAIAASEATLYANWISSQGTKYTVTYKDGDEIIKSVEVLEGLSLTLDEAPVKDDYNFLGWIINGDIYQAGTSITVTDNIEVVANYKAKEYKAEITVDGISTKYENAADATTALANLSTTESIVVFKLLDDITTSKTIGDSTLDLTIDLNGHTLKYTANSRFFRAANALTIDDTSEDKLGVFKGTGTYTSATGSAYGLLSTQSSGKLTIKAGTIDTTEAHYYGKSSTNTHPYDAIYIGSGTEFEMTGGRIDAGLYNDSEEYGAYVYSTTSAVSTATISGGIISYFSGSASADMTITGGAFGNKVTPAEGYVCIYDVEDGLYKVYSEADAPLVASIDEIDEKYATIDEAISAAVDILTNGFDGSTYDEVTVKLLKDCTKTTTQTTIPVGKILNFDLNGKTITNVASSGTATSNRYFYSKGTVNILDTSDGMTGKMIVNENVGTSNGGIAFAYANEDGTGSVYVTSGNFFQNSAGGSLFTRTANDNYSGLVAISGGYFTAAVSNYYLAEGYTQIELVTGLYPEAVHTVTNNIKTISFNIGDGATWGGTDSQIASYNVGYLPNGNYVNGAKALPQHSNAMLDGKVAVGWSTDPAAEPGSDDILIGGIIPEVDKIDGEDITFYVIYRDADITDAICKDEEGTYYTSLTKAFSTANSKITMLKDYVGTSTLPAEREEGVRNVIDLDLAGFTISGSEQHRVGSAMTIYGTLNLYDSVGGGIIEGFARGNGGGMELYNGALLNMYGGTIQGIAPKGQGGAISISKGATVNIYAGTIVDLTIEAAEQDALLPEGTPEEERETNYDIGTIYGLDVKGVLNILPENNEDAKINSVILTSGEGTVYISGGLFLDDTFKTFANFVDENGDPDPTRLVVDYDDEVYNFTIGTAEAMVTCKDETTYYETIEEAAKAVVEKADADNAGTLTLLKDAVIEARIGFTDALTLDQNQNARTIILDLNGHELRTDGVTNGPLAIGAKETLIIKDSAEEGKITAATNYFIYLSSTATVQIQSGKFTGADKIKSGNGTLQISGGTYSVAPEQADIVEPYIAVKKDGLYTLEVAAAKIVRTTSDTTQTLYFRYMRSQTVANSFEDNLQAGDEGFLLKDATATDIKIPVGATINVGGFSYKPFVAKDEGYKVVEIETGVFSVEQMPAYIATVNGEVTADSITMNFNVKVTDGTQAPVLTYTYDGEEYTVEGVAGEENTYVYTITGIALNRLADDLELKLTSADGETTYEEKSYSVRDYFNQLAKDADDDLKTLLVSILELGQQLQLATGEGTAITFSDGGWELAAIMTDVKAEDATNALKITVASQDENNVIKAAGLNLLKETRLYFDITLDKTNKVVVKSNGVDVEDIIISTERCTTAGARRYYLPEFGSDAYDDVVVVQIVDGDAVINEVEYSVNTYCFAKANDEEAIGTTTVGALVDTIYRYGVATQAYLAK